MAECIHGLEEEWCATCKHGPEINPPETIEYSFTAKYASHCNECDLPIAIGQRASKTSRDRVIHEDCKP